MLPVDAQDNDLKGSTAHVGVIDWRNKDAADYYVNEVIGLHTATDKNIDGAENALSCCIAKHHLLRNNDHLPT